MWAGVINQQSPYAILMSSLRGTGIVVRDSGPRRLLLAEYEACDERYERDRAEFLSKRRGWTSR